jgi:hypothetical protein
MMEGGKKKGNRLADTMSFLPASEGYKEPLVFFFNSLLLVYSQILR